jgi:hypothetical protein
VNSTPSRFDTGQAYARRFEMGRLLPEPRDEARARAHAGKEPRIDDFSAFETGKRTPAIAATFESR